MSLLGTHLALMIGPTVPLPAPPMLANALKTIEVTHTDEGRSGFQLTFDATRTGPTEMIDYELLTLPLLKPFSRVVIIVTFNAFPRVLMDGFITHQQVKPGAEGSATVTVTGEDVSLMMDMEEKIAAHPAQPEIAIAAKIIATYAQYGLIPMVLPPVVMDVPIPIERIPVQHETDLAYLQTMAARHGYVFYVSPGPAPLTNTAYWGPPVRVGIPQRALSYNMGPNTNVSGLDFQYDALAPTTVSGKVQDRLTNAALPVQTFASTRLPPLAAMPALPLNMPNIRTTVPTDTSGLNIAQALGRAQAATDRSTDKVVTVTGELDATVYNDVLQTRGLVGVRGVGITYGGLYYVKKVTHKIERGNSYKQSFTLTREGIMTTTPVVVP
jgi:hypothetical protein